MNVRASLMKTKPTSQAEVLKQPIFGNPLVTNVVNCTLGVNGLSEGRTITKARCTKIKDLWDWEDREWKSLPTLGMNSHIINRTNKDIIIFNIPWNPVTFLDRFQIGTGSALRLQATSPLSLALYFQDLDFSRAGFPLRGCMSQIE